MNTVKTFFNNILPLPSTDLELLAENWVEVSFRKKEIISYEGQLEQYIYIVIDGVQRAYYVKDGKEITVVFTYPPSFCGNIDSLLSSTKNQYYIESITNSKLLRRRYKEIETLSENHSNINRLMRKVLEIAILGVNRKHYELLALNMEEKFEAFYQRSAHLINLVPHKYIASYLGMDPTNFSKVLKNHQ